MVVYLKIKELVDRYIEEIYINDVDYVPWNDAPHDCAYLSLDVPRAFLDDYLVLQGQKNKKWPDGIELWNTTELRERLKGKKPRKSHAPLSDILEFLGGRVQVDYYVDYYDYSKVRVGIGITEFPREFNPE